MQGKLSFLKNISKNHNGLYIVYGLYTFDNLFRLLLKNGFSHEQSLSIILCNCSLSALVFQERIHNHAYRELSAKEALPPDYAACRESLIYDLIIARVQRTIVACRKTVEQAFRQTLTDGVLVSIRALMLWHLSREIVVPMDTRGDDSRHLQFNNSNLAAAK